MEVVVEPSLNDWMDSGAFVYLWLVAAYFLPRRLSRNSFKVVFYSLLPWTRPVLVKEGGILSLWINQDAQCMLHSHIHTYIHTHVWIHHWGPISHRVNIKNQNAPNIPILEEKTQTCFESWELAFLINTFCCQPLPCSESEFEVRKKITTESENRKEIPFCQKFFNRPFSQQIPIQLQFLPIIVLNWMHHLTFISSCFYVFYQPDYISFLNKRAAPRTFSCV